MKDTFITIDDFILKPLTPQLWHDFEVLFGPKGAYGGCWCMWWRCTRKEFSQNQGDGNRLAMKSIVDSGIKPGLIAYKSGIPCGWCSVAPREEFSSLTRSRVLKPIDEKKVWSIICFYIPKQFRKQRISEVLVKGALEYVRENEGSIVEVYPRVEKSGKLPPVSRYMGIPSILNNMGFEIVHQPSPSRLIMRYFIQR